MPGKSYEELFELALDQYGLVTATQARHRGVTAQALAKMVKRGTIERRSKGLYRIRSIPMTQLSQLMEAVLWSTPKIGTLSHESALDVYDVSDVNPAQIHVTVPKSYRTHRQVPDGRRLHRDDLRKEEIGSFEGIPTTTLERTIRDCLSAHVGADILLQAVAVGREKGRLSDADARSLVLAIEARGRTQ